MREEPEDRRPRRIRRTEKHERARAVDQTKPDVNADFKGRRAALKWLAFGAGAAAAGGTAAYLMSKGSEKESGEYITTDEAVEIYLKLKKTIEEKWREAQQQGKPFRLFVLERHGDTNALGYEIMLIDIVQRLGIDSVLLEQSDQNVALLTNPDTHSWYRLPDPVNDKFFRVILKVIHTAELRPIGVDNRWPTAESYAESVRSCLARLVYEEISKRYTVSDYQLNITGKVNDQFLENSIIEINGKFSPKPPSSEEKADLIRIAKGKVADELLEERNKEILKGIEQTKQSFMITGKNHAIGLISALRNRNQVCLGFSIRNRSLERQYMEDETVSDKQKEALTWANDPANVIQCEGKDFNPNDLPAFIEKVIEKVNSKGAWR